jgi:hypothetical protein
MRNKSLIAPTTWTAAKVTDSVPGRLIRCPEIRMLNGATKAAQHSSFLSSEIQPQRTYLGTQPTAKDINWTTSGPSVQSPPPAKLVFLPQSRMERKWLVVSPRPGPGVLAPATPAQTAFPIHLAFSHVRGFLLGATRDLWFSRGSRCPPFRRGKKPLRVWLPSGHTDPCPLGPRWSRFPNMGLPPIN